MAEKEYIERNGVMQKFADRVCLSNLRDFPTTTPTWNQAVQIVETFPAADVRPVVTCGKCKHGKYTGTEWFCDKHSGHADKFGEDASYHEYHSKHWFCADGEARV